MGKHMTWLVGVFGVTKSNVRLSADRTPVAALPALDAEHYKQNIRRLK